MIFNIFTISSGVIFSTPWLLSDPEIALTKSDIGLISSYFSLAYGVSKCIGSIISDYNLSCRNMFVFGLFGSALCGIGFGASGHLQVFMIMWAASGFFQGLGNNQLP